VSYRCINYLHALAVELLVVQCTDLSFYSRDLNERTAQLS